MKNNIVAKVYYYAVMFVSLIFLSISVVGLVRGLLINSVFTELKGDRYSNYSYYCDNIGRSYPTIDGKLDESLESIEECQEREKRNEEERYKKDFQDQMLTFILMFLVSGSVMLSHYFIFKHKKEQ